MLLNRLDSNDKLCEGAPIINTSSSINQNANMPSNGNSSGSQIAQPSQQSSNLPLSNAASSIANKSAAANKFQLGDDTNEEDSDELANAMIDSCIEGDSEKLLKSKINIKTSANQAHSQSSACTNIINAMGVNLMPHDKLAINFLINEFLLEQGYKVTSVTFSEENESQDLEDWDVIGLNRPKPPSLRQLYSLYLSKLNNQSRRASINKASIKDSKSVEVNTDRETEASIEKTAQLKKTLVEQGAQIEWEKCTVATNTPNVTVTDRDTLVNLDKDIFDTQRMQISKLLDKQSMLLESIGKLENEISVLNQERENHLKRIETL
jgi:hypothetical protein